MNGYGYRSWTRGLIGLVFRALLTTLALSFLGMLFAELLIVIGGILALALVAAIWLRISLFRWRRW